jgi:Na+-driven multidrug efflux pump
MTAFLNTSKRSAGKLGMVGAAIANVLSFFVAIFHSVKVAQF